MSLVSPRASPSSHSPDPLLLWCYIVLLLIDTSTYMWGEIMQWEHENKGTLWDQCTTITTKAIKACVSSTGATIPSYVTTTIRSAVEKGTPTLLFLSLSLHCYLPRVVLPGITLLTFLNTLFLPLYMPLWSSPSTLYSPSPPSFCSYQTLLMLMLTIIRAAGLFHREHVHCSFFSSSCKGKQVFWA